MAEDGNLAAILDFWIKMSPNIKNNHSISFPMLKVAGKHTSFAILSQLVPKILNYCFFKMADDGNLAAILDFLVKMNSNLKNNHSISFPMLKLAGKDTSFVILSHLVTKILRF